jgi:hypothetical protein
MGLKPRAYRLDLLLNNPEVEKINGVFGFSSENILHDAGLPGS